MPKATTISGNVTRRCLPPTPRFLGPDRVHAKKVGWCAVRTLQILMTLGVLSFGMTNAQPFPTKPVRLVSTAVAGATDTVGRLMRAMSARFQAKKFEV